MRGSLLLLRLLCCTGIGSLCFTSCSTTEFVAGKGLATAEYKAFLARPDYPETSDTFRDAKLLARAKKNGESEIRIDLSEQRARLMMDEAVALDAPCCTGRAGKRTPVGSFPIVEKIEDKRSTIFGKLYRRGRQVYRGDRRRYRGSYDRYIGASLPYWMRLTNDGIGLHASAYVHRFPKSNGCVRIPPAAIETMYAAVEPGTRVQIVP